MMRRRRFLTTAACAMAGVTVGSSLWLPAAEGGCVQCRRSPCRKVCRLVCEERKVEVVCWGCQSEDFCPGAPSHPGCRHYETVCDDAEDKVCVKPKLFSWLQWIPGCCCDAQVYTRKKLMKKVITKKVPSFRWEVVELCDGCESRCEGAEVAAGTPLPDPPLAGAPLKYRVTAAPETR